MNEQTIMYKLNVDICNWKAGQEVSESALKVFLDIDNCIMSGWITVVAEKSENAVGWLGPLDNPGPAAFDREWYAFYTNKKIDKSLFPFIQEQIQRVVNGNAPKRYTEGPGKPFIDDKNWFDINDLLNKHELGSYKWEYPISAVQRIINFQEEKLTMHKNKFVPKESYERLFEQHQQNLAELNNSFTQEQVDVIAEALWTASREIKPTIGFCGGITQPKYKTLADYKNDPQWTNNFMPVDSIPGSGSYHIPKIPGREVTKSDWEIINFKYEGNVYSKKERYELLNQVFGVEINKVDRPSDSTSWKLCDKFTVDNDSHQYTISAFHVVTEINFPSRMRVLTKGDGGFDFSRIQKVKEGNKQYSILSFLDNNLDPMVLDKDEWKYRNELNSISDIEFLIKFYKINSIRREIDGLEIRLGDIDRHGRKVAEIRKTENLGVLIFFDQGGAGQPLCNFKHFHSSDCSSLPFTTTDGVIIKAGDDFCYVDKDWTINWLKGINSNYGWFHPFDPTLKTFSTDQAAKDWITWNKPQHSLAAIMAKSQLLKAHDGSYMFYLEDMKKAL